MTTKTAIRVVREIINENRENGELEGILNRGRIAALERLVFLAQRRLEPKRRTPRHRPTSVP